RLEMIYSVADFQGPDGGWQPVGGEPLTWGAISHGNVLYSAGLSFLSYSLTCYRMGEPLDWNLWRRMSQIGVRIGFLNHLTYRHYWSPMWSLDPSAGCEHG